MAFIDTLQERNADFAATGFVEGLTLFPKGKTLIIGCVDPRVDPADIFGLELGDAVVIRNVGGRVYRNTVETLAVLGSVARSAGGKIGEGWTWIVLHHTGCGIVGCHRDDPDLLARHFEVETSALATLAIDDPHAAVALDVARLKANPNLPAQVMVCGMVYDVDTGLAEMVVPPAPLRAD